MTQAARELQSISGWREADEKVQNYMSKVEEIKAEQERKRLEEERQEELARIAAIKRERRKKIFSALATIVIIAGIAFAYQWTNVIYPTQQYDKAMDLIAEKNYEEAYAILDELGDFKDAAEQIPLSEYNRGLELAAEGNYEEAYFLFQKLGDYKDCTSLMEELAEKEPRVLFKTTEVGDVLEFGSYEQDNDTSNGQEPIEWIVFQKEEDKVLLLSKKCLDCRPYNKELKKVTWKGCTLRKWLNRKFLNTAFSENEKEYIIPSEVVYGSSKRDATVKDQIFLLNKRQVGLYKNENQAKATAYAVAKGAYVSETTGYSIWWVCSPSGYYTNSYGSMSSSSRPLNDETIGVRPAMWVSLEDVVQETEEAE